MSEFLIKAWIARRSVSRICSEARRKFPLESGGLLIGYWCSDRECVVRHITTAGPKAKHYKTRYVPDVNYDTMQVARFYNSSDGSDTYLGDWHSHPNTRQPCLSAKDQQALSNIATSEEARAPRPLSLICAGEPGAWRVAVWMGEMTTSLFKWQFITTTRAHLEVFDVGAG